MLGVFKTYGVFFSIDKDIEFDGTNPMNFDWCIVSNDNVLIS